MSNNAYLAEKKLLNRATCPLHLRTVFDEFLDALAECRLVGETGCKFLDELEVKFLFHLVKHKMPYVAVGMALDEVNLIVEVFFDDGLHLCVKFLNLGGIGLRHFSVDGHNPALV